MTIRFYKVQEYYGCFSNFSPHPVTIDGKVWPTNRHYFQAMKFPHDPARQEKIWKAPGPTKAKKIAWDKTARIRAGWDGMRDQVMLTALRAKFTQHADIREILLSTGDQLLVEHTRNDSYWGDGGDGSGKNRLGKLLMRVRGELRGKEIS